MTADNFFHADQFSGSGGWSGRNRALPAGYAASAKLVLRSAPEWVLAEHGGAFVFSVEDFHRREAWASAAAHVADALSPSGDYRRDWDPHRIRVEPLIQAVRPGETRIVELVIDHPREKLTIEIEGRDLIKSRKIEVTPGKQNPFRKELRLEVAEQLPPGRHVIPLVVTHLDREDPADVFFVLEVE